MHRLRSAAHLLQGASPIILSIILGISGLVAFLLLLLPLGGWAPLAPFSLRFPLGSRVGGGCDLRFLPCSLASCCSCIYSVGIG